MRCRIVLGCFRHVFVLTIEYRKVDIHTVMVMVTTMPMATDMNKNLPHV